MAADAATDLIERLKDESRWVIRRGVPLFTPHKRIVGGVEKYEVKDADIPVIAAKTAALESEHGVVGRITPGHVKFDDTPEDKQPPLYGFHKNARIGTYGPKNKPAVLVDNYYFPEHSDKADRLPFRSAEYYHDKREIRGQALLIRDGYLPLGAAAYETTDVPECYSMPVMGGDQKFTPEEINLFDRIIEYLTAKGMCPDPAEKVADDAEADPKKAVSADSDENPKKPEQLMADTAVTPELYAALETRVTAAEAENAKLRKDLADAAERTTCERLVMGLKAEGYQLDAATVTAEVAELMPRDKAGREKRVGELRLIHAKAKAPNTTPIDVYDGNVTPEGGPNQYHAEPPYYAAAVKYMRSNHCDWDTAVEAVKGK